ncbi:MAG: sensor domain-containing diguanylate cyclase [Planctomycetes bacterium]|nr:sensor domain-containing diguanylate cyclase [Planctomycetota bacterium]
MPNLVEQLTALELRALEDDATGVSRQRRRGSNLVQVAAAHHAIVELRSVAAIPEILSRGVDLLHRDLGFDRLVVLEREHSNPSAARVRAVACRTRLAGPGFRSHAELPVAARGALDRVFDGELSAMSEADTDDGALRFLGADAFAVAALRAGSGAMGAVLGDHFLSGRRISPEDVAALGVAASALGMVLENAALHAEGKTLRSLAERDSLTGINNRRNVLEILRREIDRSRRYGKPLAVAMIDVDHFKSWNDHYGHQVGDTVLQTVAQIISSTGREIDACGRYGGEEFLVVLPETVAENAVLYAERLRVAIEMHGVDLSAVYTGLSLSVSIGVTQLLPRGDDADQMIHRADVALYQAKEHGRNLVCVEWTAQPVRAAPPMAKGILGDV